MEDKNIKFTGEDMKDDSLPFLDCAWFRAKDGNLNIGDSKTGKQHTHQYLLFDSQHPLEQKLGVIWTLEDRTQRVPTTIEGKQKELSQIKKALQTCGYTKWTFIKSSKKHRKEQPETGPNQVTLKAAPGPSKDKTPRHKLSNVVYAIQCTEE